MSNVDSIKQRHNEVLEDASLEDYERATELEKLARDYREAGAPGEAQQALAEATAFRLMLEGHVWPNHDLQPYCVLVDGRTIPALNEITEDLLRFLDLPIQRTKNPIARARLADVRWEFSKPRKGQSAQIAIDAYAASLQLHLDAEDFHLLFEAAKRATRLASQTKDTVRLEALLRQWVQIARFLATAEHGSWCARCVDVLEAVRGDMRPDWLIKELHCVLGDARQAIRDKADAERSASSRETRFRELCEAQVILETAGSSPDEIIRDLRLDIVRSFIDEGDFYAETQSDPLRALFCYQPAEQLARNIGASAEMEKARTKLASVGAQINPEDHAHTVELPVALGSIDSLIAPLLGDSTSDFLARVSRSEALRPSARSSRDTATQIARSFPLQSLSSHLRLRGGHIVSTTASEGIPVADQIATTLCLQAQLGGIVLDRAFATLAETHGVDGTDVREHFSQAGLQNISVLAYIEVGVDRILAEDYSSAIHVLVPQVEALCRHIVAARGGTTTIPGDGVPQLGTLLESTEIVDAIGSDLTQALKAVFRDSNGMWLRTRVAHGMLPVSDATRETAMTVLLLLLQLSPALEDVGTESE